MLARDLATEELADAAVSLLSVRLWMLARDTLAT